MTYIEERAAEIAEIIRKSQTWPEVHEEVTELCKLAGMSEEWEAADGETFESVAFAAATKLGVEII